MLRLLLCLALVALASCTSGCAPFSAEARGNADYGYKYTETRVDGTKVECSAKIDSGRQVNGGVQFDICGANGAAKVSANGLNQGADRSTDPLLLLRAAQQLQNGQPVTVPAPAPVIVAPITLPAAKPPGG